MSTRTYIAALISMMVNAVVFGAGVITVLSIPVSRRACGLPAPRCYCVELRYLAVHRLGHGSHASISVAAAARTRCVILRKEKRST